MRRSDEEKSKKKKKKVIEGLSMESILDLNTSNVWNIDPHEIAILWEAEKQEGNFTSSEEKLLNVMRLAFDVVHYNANDSREKTRYENGEWITFTHCNPGKETIAIQKKHITRLTDLSYENIQHITPATLLELIDRNFGGGWDSISLAMRDIIESGFDISTTTLPEKRLHMVGGTLDKKIAQGYEVLEIPKGTWIEAIFAKKKDKVVKLHINDQRYDEDGNLLKTPIRDDEEMPEDPEDKTPEEEEEVNTSDTNDDDTYYSTFAEEAVEKNEDEEGFPIEDE